MNRLPPMLKCARNSTAELTIFVPSTVIIISGRGRKQPDRMAGKFAREMLAFYGPYCPAYYRWKTRHLSREYSQSLIAIQAADLRRQWARYKPLENLIHRTTELAQNGLGVPVPRFLWRCQLFLARTYSLAIGISAAAIVVILFPSAAKVSVGCLRDRSCISLLV